MPYRSRPIFIIKKNMQKSTQTGIYFDSLITNEVLTNCCSQILGISDFDTSFVDNSYSDEFLDATYNQGRLAILQYHDSVFYISFSDEKCEGRNSGIQSVPTAFNRFYSNSHQNKKLYFYFLPCSGNNATSYYQFMYRLMKTAGFNFLNIPQVIGEINPFNSIDDIIRARKENGERNSGNNATYLIKSDIHDYEIYGKTYGANKYDTSLICYAVSKIAKQDDKITLYEYNEKDLKELPEASLTVLRSMGNISIINIDDELERRELEENDSLRSPRFNARLLDRLGERHCVLCNCGMSELIQGAHIWPVADIKKATLTLEDKLSFATDGENGLWMCQNHHKMFDSNILFLSENGEVSYRSNLSENDVNYANSVTTKMRLDQRLVTPKYREYIQKRYHA